MSFQRQPDDLVAMYRLMLLTRRYTEHCLRWYREGRIIQGLHPSIGQEAVGVGACYGLRDSDWVLPSLRTSEAFFVRGVSLRQHVAAMNGRVTGISRGKDTSHHAGYPEHGVLAGTGMVGSHIPVGVGAALALKMQATDGVVVVFFGDGASNRGDFHEGLNLAAALQAPVIFVCENNGYAQTVPAMVAMRVQDIAKRAEGYGMPGVVVDGQDVLAVQDVVQAAVERARAGQGPTLVECKTYRFAPHHVTFTEDRPSAEVERWRARDPIRLLGDHLLEHGVLSQAEMDAMDAAILAELDDAIRYAEDSPWPEPQEVLQHIYAPLVQNTPDSHPAKSSAWRKRSEGSAPSDGLIDHTYAEALNAALHEVMRADDRVFVLGEDIGLCNGLFGVTRGLLDAFGPQRVIDTPISESGITGVAVGAAVLGMRPVVEIQFTDAVPIALDHIVNTAAKASYVHAGQLSLPLVVRLLNLHSGTVYSSQALEAWFMHVPGLRVVTPATPDDAKGLLTAAIADPNPVIFIENRILYPQRGPVPPGDYTVPLGQAAVRRVGRDVTVVAYGQMVPAALEAAATLAAAGIEAEVLDLRTLAPLDEAAILASVRKTGRLVVAHEAVKTAGPGAEIAALVAEHALPALKAPIRRVANPGAPVPFSPALHPAVLPGAA
ncbi:MAG: dehydrogenase E1 component subunit alpha/beta, partial [Anaerolineae bacterium]|nr:dehydrogenase E1 component subunit alpha/beta [Anaerolineae bacterium]